MTSDHTRADPADAVGTDHPLLVVCIPTHDRMGLLLRALDAVDAQILPKGARPFRLAVLVIDNGTDGTVAGAIARAGHRWRWPVRVIREAAPGIAQARNAALAWLRTPAGAGVAWVAFLDDDESPAQDWAAALLAGADRHGAAIVSGTTRPVFPDHAPAWAVTGGFFRGKVRPDGYEAASARGSNVLIAASVLRDRGVRFDAGFGGRGGEDTVFFGDLRRMGHRIVTVPDAVVFDPVTPDRLTPSWLLRRWMAYGWVRWVSLRRTHGPLAVAGRLLAEGGVQVALGILFTVPTLLAAPVIGLTAALRSAKRLCRGASMLLIVLGVYAGPNWRRRRPAPSAGGVGSRARSV